MATVTGDITRHPLLGELSGKVEEMLHVFNILPSMYHLDGLDILQGLVNIIIRKITHGKVNSVKFVPVEDNEKLQLNRTQQQTASLNVDGTGQLIAIKSEPRDCDEDDSWEDDLPLSQVASSSDTTSTATCNAQLVQLQDGSYAYITSPSQSSSSTTSITAKKKKATPKSQPKKIQAKKSPARSPKANLKSPKKAPKKQNKNTVKEKVKKKKTPKTSPKSKNTVKEPTEIKVDVETNGDHSLSISASPGVYSAPPGGVLEEAGEEEKRDLMLKLIPPQMRLKCGKPKKGRLAGKDAKFECANCDYKTDKKFHMDSHMIRHTKVRKFNCKKCGKFFTAASSLRRHLLIHDGIKRHMCPVCAKTFIDLGGLRCHSVVHTGERLYECNQCNKKYTNAGNLRRHKRLHSGEKPYVCQVCDVSYRDLSSLRLHMLKHTGEKPFQCQFCHKQFKTSSDFRRHERIHTGERKYTCKDCDKTFVQGWHLKQHQRLHGNRQPWGPCDLCNKSFCTKAALQHHQRWHAGVKPYTCARCHKSFSTKKYLEMHQVVHTAAKPFTCKTCGTDFNQVSNLKRHERIHSAVKRYKCQYCPKAFKYVNSLQYHEGIHTGAAFTCEKCGLSRRSKAGIRRHTCSMALVDKMVKDDAEEHVRQEQEQQEEKEQEAGGDPTRQESSSPSLVSREDSPSAKQGQQLPEVNNFVSVKKKPSLRVSLAAGSRSRKRKAAHPRKRGTTSKPEEISIVNASSSPLEDKPLEENSDLNASVKSELGENHEGYEHFNGQHSASDGDTLSPTKAVEANDIITDEDADIHSETEGTGVSAVVCNGANYDCPTDESSHAMPVISKVYTISQEHACA